MGTKRTIDSGRKDKKGRPIKVSENSLAASDNVDSKKNQLGDSSYSYESEVVEYDRISDLLYDLPSMNYRKNYNRSHDRDGANSIASEISSGDGDGSGTTAIPEHFGENKLQRKANLVAMFPEWDGEKTDYETDNGCIINSDYELEIPGNVLVKMTEEDDDEIIDSLKYLETSPVLDNAVFEDFLDAGAREAMTENDWNTTAENIGEIEKDLVYNHYRENLERDIDDRIGIIYDEEEYFEAVDAARIDLDENYEEWASLRGYEVKERIEGGYEDFISHIKENYTEFLDWDDDITVLDSQEQQYIEDHFMS